MDRLIWRKSGLVFVLQDKGATSGIDREIDVFGQIQAELSPHGWLSFHPVFNRSAFAEDRKLEAEVGTEAPKLIAGQRVDVRLREAHFEILPSDLEQVNLHVALKIRTHLEIPTEVSGWFVLQHYVYAGDRIPLRRFQFRIRIVA